MKPALILVDLQQAFLNPDGSYAKRGYSLADTQETINNCGSLIDIFRKSNSLIVHIVTEYSSSYCDAGVVLHDLFPETMTYNGYLAHNGESEPSLEPMPGELIIRKKRYDPFFSTDLDRQLRSRNINTVIIAGILTNVCVYACSLSAVDRDYFVYLAEDCTTAWTRDIKNFFIQSLCNHIGKTASASDVKAMMTLAGGMKTGHETIKVVSTGMAADMDRLLSQRLQTDSTVAYEYVIEDNPKRFVEFANIHILIVGNRSDNDFIGEINTYLCSPASDGLIAIISLRPSSDAQLNLGRIKSKRIQYVPMTAVYQQTTADHVALLILAAHRQLSKMRLCQSAAPPPEHTPIKLDPSGLDTVNWNNVEDDFTFNSQDIVFLGFGGIALEIVSRYRFNNANCYYLKRNCLSQTMESLLNIRAIDWNTAFTRANILVLTLPLTEDTCGLIGDDYLRQLPQGAIIIQAGRAAVIQEKALFQTLSTRKDIRYYADVHYREPTHGSDPFLTLDNVLLTPHYGGGIRYRHDTVSHIHDNLNAVAKGGRAPHQLSLPGWPIPWEQFLSGG